MIENNLVGSGLLQLHIFITAAWNCFCKAFLSVSDQKVRLLYAKLISSRNKCFIFQVQENWTFKKPAKLTGRATLTSWFHVKCAHELLIQTEWLFTNVVVRETDNLDLYYLSNVECDLQMKNKWKVGFFRYTYKRKVLKLLHITVLPGFNQFASLSEACTCNNNFNQVCILHQADLGYCFLINLWISSKDTILMELTIIRNLPHLFLHR